MGRLSKFKNMKKEGKEVKISGWNEKALLEHFEKQVIYMQGKISENRRAEIFIILGAKLPRESLLKKHIFSNGGLLWISYYSYEDISKDKKQDMKRLLLKRLLLRRDWGDKGALLKEIQSALKEGNNTFLYQLDEEFQIIEEADAFLEAIPFLN